MGLLDVLLGRSKPAPANLDQLFALPSAAITLEAAEGLVPLGKAGVCFKPATGQAFADTERELSAMLQVDSSSGTAESAQLSDTSDDYGYRWVVIAGEDFNTLVTRTHFVNSTLHDNGYGPTLLCSVFGFGEKASPGAPDASARLYLVYLYKRGTFYPFVPTGAQKRDNEAELRFKNELDGDVRIEPELDRWFPIWDLPLH